MRRIAIGVQKTDRDRFDSGVAQRKRRAPHIPLVQRLAHRPVCQQPFADLLSPHAGHQRGRLDDRVVIKMRAGLARKLEYIAKPAGGDQPARGALALDNEIGRHGGAVTDVANLIGPDRMIAQQIGDAALDRLGRIVRRRRHLVKRNAAGLLIHQREVGERATDIDSNAIHERRIPRLMRCGHGRSHPRMRQTSCSRAGIGRL